MFNKVLTTSLERTLDILRQNLYIIQLIAFFKIKYLKNNVYDENSNEMHETQTFIFITFNCI